MTIIEQIKAEIERLKGQLIRGACAAQIEMETNCKEEAYDEILSFLSTLESEKPIPKDLKEAARLYAIPHYMRDVYVDYLEEYPYDKIAEVAFIAGAEWQEKQDLKYISEIHRNGYNLCKEQMMKEAVEGEYGYFSNASKTILPSGKLNIKEGDKVRVIVCKKED